MTDAAVDLGQLREDQQLALQQFTSVTDADVSAAIPLLQRSQWNVQIAIAKFFDGEQPDPVQEAIAARNVATPPRQSGRREVLLDGMQAPRRQSPRSTREPAPRIVPQTENRNLYKPPFILALLLSPLNLILRILSGSFSLFGQLFPFLPRLFSALGTRATSQPMRRNITGRRPLNPRDTAARFVREFGEEYGEHDLHFFDEGYAQAYDIAKRDLKYLLVVLLSSEHDDTTTWVRQTLLSPEVVSFINNPDNKILLWGGNVEDSEAYQVSTAINCTKFPFAGIIAHTPQDSATAMSTIARVSGLIDPSSFVSKLRTAIAQYSSAIERIRSQRAEQEATRNLREEQHSAYERSLAQDRERVRLRKEAEAAKAREEEKVKQRENEKKSQAEKVLQWKKWRSSTLLPEPEAGVKDASRLSLRLPSGERLVRGFAASATVEDLYAWVECHDLEPREASGREVTRMEKPVGYEHSYAFRLVSPMPRAVYEPQAGATVGERIGRSGNLIVEPIDDEDGQE